MCLTDIRRQMFAHAQYTRLYKSKSEIFWLKCILRKFECDIMTSKKVSVGVFYPFMFNSLPTGYFFMLFCILLIFFKVNFKKNHSGIP